MTKAQKLARFLNEELGFLPDRVNKALDLLRAGLPQVVWDTPDEPMEAQ
jgi:hypothetical protein